MLEWDTKAKHWKQDAKVIVHLTRKPTLRERVRAVTAVLLMIIACTPHSPPASGMDPLACRALAVAAQQLSGDLPLVPPMYSS
jgi:hypothetical protein